MRYVTLILILSLVFFIIIFTIIIIPKQKVNHITAYVLKKVGFWLAKCGRPQEAIQILNKSLKLNPKDPKTRFYLGTILAMTSDKMKKDAIQQAIIELKKSIQLDDTFAPAYNNLGFCYLRLKKHKQAIECFKRAIQLDKTLTASYYGLARTYLELKHYDLALKIVDQGLKFSPKDIYLIVMKARILEEGYNDLKQAEKLCLQALKISPSSDYAKKVLKWIKYKKQQKYNNQK